MNSTIKTIIFWVLIAAGLVTLFQVLKNVNAGPKEAEFNLTQFNGKVDDGSVKQVDVTGMEVKGKLADGSSFHTTAPATYFTPEIIKKLQDKGISASFHDANSGSWGWILTTVAPFALIAGLWFFMVRQMQTGGNKALSFGKSRARLLSMQQKKVTFKDVAGVDEAKEELKEIIEFLREAQKFQKLGGRIPKGVLLVGPPGTGKTLLATGGGGRGQRAVLFDFRVRLRRNVRGRGRVAGARSV